MKEDFLHYLWQFKKFDTSNLLTSNQEPITILHSGNYLQQAGPDFFNAQIIIGSQKWAGNVEIHVRSSDWYVHHHETDTAYENVILHVVWQHDTEVFRRNNTEIPVLELRQYVSSQTLYSYQSLMLPKSWIYCERELTGVDTFIFKHYQERLFFERLEKKSNAIDLLLAKTNADWEAVLFGLLARNFGLNTNAAVFGQIVDSIPFAIIRKERVDVLNVEALLFGQAGLLDEPKEDQYFNALRSRFAYLSHKYQLQKPVTDVLQFFKLRPDNFPTIRLSQLANLYAGEQQLFSKTISAVSTILLYQVFGVGVSDYWKTHYQFDRESPKKVKSLSKSFVDLLIVNTVVPLQFAYAKARRSEIPDSIIALLEQVGPESNAIIDKFANFGIIAQNAFETQSLLQLKNEYCAKGRCLQCAVGMELLKSNPIKV